MSSQSERRAPEIIRAQDVAHRLGEGKEHQNGDGSWNTCCPAHNDKGPSLTVTDGQNNRLLVHCHAGCKQEDVIEALKRYDLWPAAKRVWTPLKHVPANVRPLTTITHPRLGPAVKIWTYYDAEGRLVGYYGRFEYEKNGKTIKELLPITWGRDDKGKEGWCWKGFVKPRPLYKLRQIIENPGVPIIVFEGEKTADAAQAIFNGDYLCIAWPGGCKAVKYADWSVLEDREVIIWRDADQPGEKAATQVAEILLQEKAATVRMVQLPGGLPEGWDIADQIPQGVRLDPYERVRTAPDYYAQSKDIVDQYNREFAMVLVGDKTAILWEKTKEDDPTILDPQFISQTAFTALFGNRYVTIGRREEPEPKVWLGSPRRRTYHGVIFEPGFDAKRDYNLWRGYAFEPEPDGDFSLLDEHIYQNIAQGDDSLYNWVMAWFAQMVQFPREKIGTSLALRGRQGTGKTILGEHIGALFPQHYILVDDPRYVIGQFNAHQASCLLLHADEAFFAGDPRHMGRLKGMVTSKTNMIEHKGKDPIAVKNYMRLFISSNEKWVVPASFEERRFAVLDVGEGKMQNKAYFGAMQQQLLNGGYEGLLYHLMHFDLSTVDMGRIPQTSALMEQKLQTMEPVVRFWYERLRDGEVLPRRHLGWPLEVGSEQLYQGYIQRCNDWGERRRLPDNTFGREIRMLSPGGQLERKKVSVEVDDGFGHLKRVRTWGYALPELKKAREAFDDAMGYKTDWDAEYAAAEQGDETDEVPF